jgi:hypothetical protein
VVVEAGRAGGWGSQTRDSGWGGLAAAAAMAAAAAGVWAVGGETAQEQVGWVVAAAADGGAWAWAAAAAWAAAVWGCCLHGPPHVGPCFKLNTQLWKQGRLVGGASSRQTSWAELPENAPGSSEAVVAPGARQAGPKGGLGMAAPAVASHCSGQRWRGRGPRGRWWYVRETRLSPRQASQRVAVPSRGCALQSHPFSPFSQFAGLLRQTLHGLLAAVSGQQERHPGGPPRPGPRLWVWRG